MDEMGTKGPYPFADKVRQYRRYTDAQLRFARKDAREARDAMAGHDLAAEAWYADDACTIADEMRRRGI